METDTIYARLQCADMVRIWLTSGLVHHVTLNTALYHSLTGKRIIRRKDLENAARKQGRIRAYFPRYKVWSEISTDCIESVEDCTVGDVTKIFTSK